MEPGPAAGTGFPVAAYEIMQVTDDGAVPLAVKPYDVDAPAARAPLYVSLRTVTGEVDVIRPFHSELIVTLPPDQVVVQPEMDVEPEFVRFTSPWKPPGQVVTVW